MPDPWGTQGTPATYILSLNEQGPADIGPLAGQVLQIGPTGAETNLVARSDLDTDDVPYTFPRVTGTGAAGAMTASDWLTLAAAIARAINLYVPLVKAVVGAVTGNAVTGTLTCPITLNSVEAGSESNAIAIMTTIPQLTTPDPAASLSDPWNMYNGAGPASIAPTTRPYATASAVWTDKEGKRGSTALRYQHQTYTPAAGGSPASLVTGDIGIQSIGDIMTRALSDFTALAGMSDAALTEVSVHLLSGCQFTLPPVPTSGSTSSIEDKVLCELVDPVGARLLFQVPAPRGAVFQVDQETLDPTEPDVSAALGQLLAVPDATSTGYYLCTPNQLPVQVYLGGYRKRAKTRRKMRPGIPTESGGD
jgi:hypothetical protein